MPIGGSARVLLDSPRTVPACTGRQRARLGGVHASVQAPSTMPVTRHNSYGYPARDTTQRSKLRPPNETTGPRDTACQRPSFECSCRSGWRRIGDCQQTWNREASDCFTTRFSTRIPAHQPDPRQPQRPHRRSRCRGPRGAHHGFQSVHLCARHWVRDTGLLDVGRAVHKLSRRRRVVHLADRGVVALGYFADVNVADRQGLELQAPDMLSDLPLGRTASCNEPAATATPSSRAGPDRP